MSIENPKHNIILFGPPAVGKSTVGRVFHDEFGFEFYDGDDEMTPEERDLVAKGQWGDSERRALLIRMGATISRLYRGADVGLTTSVALTRQWMREFLNKQAGGLLRFVLVTTTLHTDQLEKLVAKRRKDGHAITVKSFRKFTAAFEPPTMPHLVLRNPQDESKKAELVQNIAELLNQLKQ